MKSSKIEIVESSVNAALTKLSRLPKKSISLNDAINKLAPVIIDKINNFGYNYTDMCDVLAADGISISPQTLKTYLTRYKKNNSLINSEIKNA